MAFREREPWPITNQLFLLDPLLVANSPPALFGLSAIIGQTALKQRFYERLQMVSERGWPFPHTLISANAGIGRLSIATALATEITAALLRKHGYEVRSTAIVGDHGIDLELQRAGRRIVVQCKRWADTVGEPPLREFYGSMLNAGADEGIFVTTSSYSVQAREFVRGKAITLLDLQSLIELFLHGGPVEPYE